MVQRAIISLGMCLIACAILVQTDSAFAAGPDGALQPQGLTHVGIHALREIDPNLTGFGVKIGALTRSVTYADGEPQNDYRPNAGHDCLKMREFSFHDEGKLPASISSHCTTICSILFGEDPEAFDPALGRFHYEGAAPEAEADIYEFWSFLTDYVFSGVSPETDVLTVSMGTQFEQWWTRGLESLVEQDGLIVVAGIGNGSNVHDPILYPAGGANILGVGVIDSLSTEDLATNLGRFALAYPEHSSVGPTEDGRCKPDIVAPGNCLAGDAAEPNRYEPAGNWSSFSTPVVAGAIGLLVQKAKEEPRLSAAVSSNGGNCVMKALVMNSATKLPYWHKGLLETDDDHAAPLDHIQGAGMLNAVEAYKQLVAGHGGPGDVAETGWDNNVADRNGDNTEKIYRVSVAEPAGKFISATLVWNRHYEGVYPFEAMPEKDADLRLEVWAVDPNDAGRDYLLDYSDSAADNVEHIYRQADPNYTSYDIVVSFSDVEGPNGAAVQQYAVAWNAGDAAETDESLLYDLNADGVLDRSDMDVLIYSYVTYKPPGGYFMGDVNCNGVFDMEAFIARISP